jgi:hypothetical protein
LRARGQLLLGALQFLGALKLPLGVLQRGEGGIERDRLFGPIEEVFKLHGGRALRNLGEMGEQELALVPEPLVLLSILKVAGDALKGEARLHEVVAHILL